MTRSATPGERTTRLLLGLILLSYGYIAVGYARGTPRWNNPDEPAHVNVVRHIVQAGQLPILSPGDWDSELLSRLTTHWFPNDYEVDGVRYESHQPPLYYLLAAPVHRLTAGQPINRQILALRLFSIMLGAVTVVAAFAVAREVAPGRPVLAVLTAATVAYIPMHTAISAAVNNDALANALAGVTLAALMIGRRRGFSDRWAVGLGVLIGALVLTKLTVYVYVPLILGTLLVSGRAQASSWLRALRWPAIATGVSLIVAGWWVVRNMRVYGLFDPLALIRHDEIVVGQPRWSTYDLESLDFFFRILFRSFWGMFGWMGIVLDDGFYILYLVLTVLGVAGVLVGLWAGSALHIPPWGPLIPTAPQPPLPVRGRGGDVRTPREHPDAPVRQAEENDAPTILPPLRAGDDVGEADIRAAQRGWGGEVFLHHTMLLAWAALLVFGEVAYYNLTFIQPQGRYLFPALVPIALFLSSGWLQLADRATGGPVVRLLTAGVLAGAIAWALGEVHGALRAADLWSDNALIAAAAVGMLIVLLAPRFMRARLPDGLGLTLALTLGLLDLAALVKFVVPAFPLR